MDTLPGTQVLIVAHRTATTPALFAAIRARAAQGPAGFHLLVPNPADPEWHPLHPGRRRSLAEAEAVLARALPAIEQATGVSARGSVSARQDPMDAIEDALWSWPYDEIILSTLPHRISHWLHLDLPRRVAHLGLPVTTVTAPPEAEEPA